MIKIKRFVARRTHQAETIVIFIVASEIISLFFYSLPPSAKQVVEFGGKCGCETKMLELMRPTCWCSFAIKAYMPSLMALVMLELMCQQCWRGNSKAYEQELIV